MIVGYARVSTDGQTLDAQQAACRGIFPGPLMATSNFVHEICTTKVLADQGFACCANLRKRAQARGVRFGRKLKLTPHQITEAVRRRNGGEARWSRLVDLTT